MAVSWDLGPEGEPAPGDWIGLFKQNQPSNAQYLVYKKTGGEKSGMLDVVAPGVGTWEFRFLPKGSYDYVMKSNLLIIGTRDNVQIWGHRYPKCVLLTLHYFDDDRPSAGIDCVAG